MSPTLRDVARHAGVSRATASLAIRGLGRMRPETRDRVWASIAELGYVYHRGAAALRNQHTMLVGLLITDVSNPFYAGLTVALEQELGRAGLMTMLANTFDEPDRQTRLVRSMREQMAAGLVYVPVQSSRGPSPLDRGEMPALAVLRRPVGDEPFLGPDDLLAGTLAAEHLISHQRRRLVYLGGPKYGTARNDRLEAVSRIASQTDGTVVADFAGFTGVSSGIELAKQLLHSGLDFDAVICHSDVMAFSFYAVYRAAGRAVTDVSVIGLDGIPESAVFEPSLTTISAGSGALGHRAAVRIRGLIDGTDDGHAELLIPTLIRRASCGCPQP